MDLCENIFTDSKEATFVILINLTSAPVRKERSSPTSKSRREASQQPTQENGVVCNSRKWWVGSEWLLVFSTVPITLGTPHINFDVTDGGLAIVIT